MHACMHTFSPCNVFAVQRFRRATFSPCNVFAVQPPMVLEHVVMHRPLISDVLEGVGAHRNFFAGGPPFC